MDLDLFYKKLQDCIPSIEDLEMAGYDSEVAETLRNDFVISLKGNSIVNTKSTVNSFFQSFNTRGFCVFNISFLKDLEIHMEYIRFGRMNDFDLIIVNETKEVILYDSITDDVISKISESFEDFINIIPLLINYEKRGYLNLPYSRDIKDILIIELKRILKHEEYYKYFFQTIN